MGIKLKFNYIIYPAEERLHSSNCYFCDLGTNDIKTESRHLVKLLSQDRIEWIAQIHNHATPSLLKNSLKIAKKTEWCCTLFQMRSPTVTTSRLLLQFSGCWRLSRGVYTGTGPRPPDPKAAAVEGLDSTELGNLRVFDVIAILTAKKVFVAFIIMWDQLLAFWLHRL